MLTVHKVKLVTNNKQFTYFAKACGVARFAYNWALAEWQKQYESDLSPNEAKLRKQLNKIKKEKFPWMQEITKNAPQQAIKNLGQAFTRFFKKQSKYPKFKKKYIHDAFRADNGPPAIGLDAAEIKNQYIKLPKIGWIKMREKLRFTGQVKSVIISRRASVWYAAISVETEDKIHTRKNHGVIGVDLGVNALATLSNGKKYIGAKALNKLLKKLRSSNRKLARKKSKSKNRLKAKQKLAKLHAKIYFTRIDYLHKLTTSLVLNHNIIAIEDLNIKGLLANPKLARPIADQAFYEFRRQIEYKAKRYGSNIIIADKFFASSKLCSNCGTKNTELQLNQRVWKCSSCQNEHDRDINAALNLKQLVNTVSCAEIYACGVESSD